MTTTIPQANSVETLTSVIEAVAEGIDSVGALAADFEVRPRTIHYYLELAEWLGLIVNRKAAVVELSETGQSYASDPHTRYELYRDAILAHDLVEAGLRVAGEARSYDALKAAFTIAIEETGQLSAATATRRAGSLATLVSAALFDGEVDWATGRSGSAPAKMQRGGSGQTSGARTKAERPAEVMQQERIAPAEYVARDEYAELRDWIRGIVDELGRPSSIEIRDELYARHGFPLTNPAVFVALRALVQDGTLQELDARCFALA